MSSPVDHLNDASFGQKMQAIKARGFGAWFREGNKLYIRGKHEFVIIDVKPEDTDENCEKMALSIVKLDRNCEGVNGRLLSKKASIDDCVPFLPLRVERPPISFMDFLDYCERQTSSLLQFPNSFPAHSLQSLRRSHIFYIGKDLEIEKAVESVKDDLVADQTSRFPMPFSDTACVSLLADNTWVMDRLIRLSLSDVDSPPLFYEKSQLNQRSVHDLLFLCRITEGFPFPPPMAIVFHMGPRIDGIPGALLLVNPNPVLGDIHERAGNHMEFLSDFTNPVLFQMSMISHPMNYLVKTSPKLTTKEQHWVESGKRPIPIRKTPHFIVVDHTVLVRMRNGEHGDDQEGELDRASPVPHHRRGHWARLAERCRHARLLGKDRVWKRPTFVGDRRFEDDRNYYEVVMPEESNKGLSA